MSRTYRRKNHEICQGKSSINYSKQYGWYGVREWFSGSDTQGYVSVFPYGWRQASKAERFEEWYKRHGDTEQFFDAPPPFYRKRCNRKEKLNYKKQFQRYLHNPEFEIISQLQLAFNTKGWY